MPLFEYSLGIAFFVVVKLFLKEIVGMILSNLSIHAFGYKFNKKISVFCYRIFNYSLKNSCSIEGINLCYFFIAFVYRYNVKTIIEVADLLRNRTYNPVKNRYDNIFFSYDQVIIGVIIFCFNIFIFLNIFVYYFIFLFSRFLIIETEKMICCKNSRLFEIYETNQFTNYLRTESKS
ncbi:hypothetical protein NUSPORA_00240 [Nucleospora cyclopteri]